MKDHVRYDEVASLFDEYVYYADSSDLYWYRYMWEYLEKHGLTQYENNIEYYCVIFRAVALIYMFQGFIAAMDGVRTFPDCVYENCLSDIIPEFELGQIFAKEGFDDIETEKSYAVFILAQKEYRKIRDAVLSEMSFEQLLQTMLAVFYSETRFVQEDDEETEEWSPETYEEYCDLVSNRLDDIDMNVGLNPSATYDWVAVNEAYFDIYQ